MPAIGDQHRPQAGTAAAAAAANPFDEAAALNDKRQHVNEYTAVEIARLQSRLDKQLGPEYISSRSGPGGARVHYLAADKVISLANEIFGFNGWSSAIQQIQIDFVDEHPATGKVSLGLSVVVRVTLKDGTYHEDVGYGSVENARGKSAAFEKAKKEGTTDALKRALRNFGNVLGNCIYDKDYVSRITKVKVGTGKWDPNSLHRHRDFEPKKEEQVHASKAVGEQNLSAATTTGTSGPRARPGAASVTLPPPPPPPPPPPATTAATATAAAAAASNIRDSSAPTEIDMGSFDMGDFDDAEFDMDDFDHPDEIALPPDSNPDGNGKTAPRPSNSAPHLTTPSRPGQATAAPMPNIRPPPPAPTASNGAQTPRNLAAAVTDAPGHGPSPTRSMGFYSARAAGKIDQDNNAINPGEAPRFDPHAQSPSIRKTSGVDHSKSVRLTRSLVVDTDIPQRDENETLALPQQRSNTNNNNNNNYGPTPISGPRPLHQNNAMWATNPRGMGTMPTSRSYRPLTRRTPDSPLPGGARQPLQDVSNLQQSTRAGGDGPPDLKRQKLTAGPAPAHAITAGSAPAPAPGSSGGHT